MLGVGTRETKVILGVCDSAEKNKPDKIFKYKI